MAEYECSDDFVNDIIIEISEIDRPTAKMMIQKAIARFCRETRTLQQVVEGTIEEGKTVYQCVPTYEAFNQTIDAVYHGEDEDSLSEYTVDDDYYISADRNSIEIDEDVVSSADGDELRIVTTMIPFNKTEVIDSNILELYSFAIIELSLFTIYNMSSKPWSNKTKASELLYSYNEMLNTVAFDSVSGNSSGDQSISLDF